MRYCTPRAEDFPLPDSAPRSWRFPSAGRARPPDQPNHQTRSHARTNFQPLLERAKQTPLQLLRCGQCSRICSRFWPFLLIVGPADRKSATRIASHNSPPMRQRHRAISVPQPHLPALGSAITRPIPGVYSRCAPDRRYWSIQRRQGSISAGARALPFRDRRGGGDCDRRSAGGCLQHNHSNRWQRNRVHTDRSRPLDLA